ECLTRQPVGAGRGGQRRFVDEVDSARRHQEEPRLVPVRGDQQRNVSGLPRGEGSQRRGRQDRSVDGGRERQQAQRELPPPCRIRRGLHLHYQVRRGRGELVQRDRLDRVPVRRHAQCLG